MFPTKPWTPTTITTITHSSSHRRRDTMHGETNTKPPDVLMVLTHQVKSLAITESTVIGRICTRMSSGSIPPLVWLVPTSVISIELSMEMLPLPSAIEIRRLELMLIPAALCLTTTTMWLQQRPCRQIMLTQLLAPPNHIVQAGTCKSLKFKAVSTGTMTVFSRTCFRIGLIWSMTVTSTAKRLALSSL